MNIKLKPSKVLNAAYRKHDITRNQINSFKELLSDCLGHIQINEEKGESEEHMKKPLSDFLQKAFYQDHLINTKDRIDLAIYLGKNAKSKVGVLIEAKRPSNTSEFLKPDNLNKKALQELLLYYLRERVTGQNNNIKHLIATNGYEWYFFKGEDFYEYFYKNKKLLKEYKEFVEGKKDSSKNELFYKEIAAKYIEEVQAELPFLYVNIKDVEDLLSLENTNDKKLISLYKVFSPTHLLGQSFGNDSNQLNKQFYYELLHIIGLEETKAKGKKIIQRKAKDKRNFGSLLESTIFILDDRDYLRKVDKLSSYGKTREEQLFSVGLELCLTWVNRILFLKLLESQLLAYHKGDKHYRFLNNQFVRGFDDLEELFFSALAKRPNERNERIKEKYQYIPYLNSSLFEPNQLEDQALQISNVKDADLELYDKTILKGAKGKRQTGKLNNLDYLFGFLDAYDFSSEGTENVDESNENKSLINASVLGLIFEKINGYKDGSFYTPAYITMYMSRETLRRAVVQKFNTKYNWTCKSFEDLKEDLKDHIRSGDRTAIRKEANQLVNSLKICDPAVGSGHFLVSCLNELIVIKSDLGVFIDKTGKRLNTYIHLENDELIIEDENEELFEYKPNNSSSQRIQETLFHEKQTLIENCLFGVDLNPNSVKICRLRLWIELLKNAYYTDKKELQTLPNIDINIKTGNSLISRFALDDDLKKAFKSKTNPYSLKDYKKAVQDYKQTNDKTRKREVLQIIDTVKTAFKATIDTRLRDRVVDAQKTVNTLEETQRNLTLFGEKIKKVEKDKLKAAKKLLSKRLAEKAEIENNVIYQNAFEWRFEFPEVLDSKGAYLGFDVVVGNPPYISGRDFGSDMKIFKSYYNKAYYTAEYQLDLYQLFIELGCNITNSELTLIIPNTWLANHKTKKIRKFVLENLNINSMVFSLDKIFLEAEVDVVILDTSKQQRSSRNIVIQEVLNTNIVSKHIINQDRFSNTEGNVINIYISESIADFLGKIESNSVYIRDIFKVNRGIHPYRKDGYGQSKFQEGFQTLRDYEERSYHSNKQKDKTYKQELKGKHVFPYYNINSETYVSYGDWLAEPRTIDFFQGERIYLRKILGKKGLIANAIMDDSVADQSLYIAKKKNDDFLVKYVLGILNSNLIGMYFKLKNNEFDKLFPQIKVGEFKALPIKKAPKKNQELVETLVHQILALKKENPEADTSQLEAQIDILVYKLYGLTYAEVLIVDKDFGLSEQAYLDYAIN